MVFASHSRTHCCVVLLDTRRAMHNAGCSARKWIHLGGFDWIIWIICIPLEWRVHASYLKINIGSTPIGDEARSLPIFAFDQHVFCWRRMCRRGHLYIVIKHTFSETSSMSARTYLSRMLLVGSATVGRIVWAEWYFLILSWRRIDNLLLEHILKTNG